MQANPHPRQLVPQEDVELVLDRFDDEVAQSWIHRKFAIDTSGLTPVELLETFLERSVPYLNTRDALTRMQ